MYFEIKSFSKINYAYQPTESTKNVLQNLISIIYLACGTTCFDCICNASLRKECINKFANAAIKGRYCKAEQYTNIAEKLKTFTTTIGCPKESILSLRLWLMVVDELLVTQKKTGLKFMVTQMTWPY